MKRLFFAAFVVILLSSVGCKKKKRVVVYTSTDQVFSEPVLKEFERRTGIEVQMVFDTEETKSTGLVNRLLAERKNPRCDVFWSNDPLRVELLRRKGLLQPYRSPNAAKIPANFKEPHGYWTGFSGRIRVILVNTKLASESPKTIRAMLEQKWRGKFALANPLFGTTSFHLAALFSIWGDGQTLEFLKKIEENGLKMAASNGEVARWVALGKVSFGVVDSDDAFSMLKEKYPVKMVIPDQGKGEMGTLFIPNAVAMIRGAPHPEEAKKLIDFLLSPAAEQMLAKADCHQIPLNSDTVVSEKLVPDISKIKTMVVNYSSVAASMERVLPILRKWVAELRGKK